MFSNGRGFVESISTKCHNVGLYVCQRAAHAIIAEIGPLRVSGDALQAINMFIDEFLALLIVTASSLDLVRIKTAVINLLPYSLGKNALVEAEIELKQQIDSEQHDFTIYEKMRSLGNDGSFPEAQVILLLQEACANYCTLAATQKDIDSLKSYTLSLQQTDTDVAVAPVIVIYVTAIVEHIAEYILNSVAMTADQMDAEHVRVKELQLSLIDDPQISPLFQRMSLKDKLEVGIHQTADKEVMHIYTRLYLLHLEKSIYVPKLLCYVAFTCA